MSICRKIFIVVISLSFVNSVFAVTGAATKNKPIEGTRGFQDEMNRPAEPWKGPPRSGAQVYAGYCATCHARTTQGAPLPDDDVEWRMRYRQGMKVLMQHVVDGYKELMPIRGGCENCSDAELKEAITFILMQSGIKPQDKSTAK